MSVSDLLRMLTRPDLRLRTRQFILSALLLTSVVLVALLFSSSPLVSLRSGASLYLLVSITLIALTISRSQQIATSYGRMVLLLSLMGDALFSLLLLHNDPLATTSVLLLYGLITIKAALLCLWLPPVLLIPCLLGSVYLTVYMSGDIGGPVTNALARMLLLIGSFGSAGVLIWLVRRQDDVIINLNRRLADERALLGGRLHEMEETATDLRTRVRELQSLEEGLRVISSSLSLTDVLKLITSGTSELLGVGRVDHAALTLLVNGQWMSHLLTPSRLQLPENWPESLVDVIVQSRQPYLALNLSQRMEWAGLASYGASAVLGVPILDKDGTVRGALAVVSRSDQGFSSTDVRHLAALASQASIAIRNAELHDKLLRQQALVEAVIRDISDGLVVIDDQGAITVTNPTARALLDASTVEPSLAERLVEMADNLRQSEQTALACELKMKLDEDRERVCQALATKIEAPAHGYIAVMLHDITAHYEEMRERTEFVSMVSHELRNPLHTLNGFLKVVLQGRAGALNEMQQEFLGLAAEQVEQLKGRIGELLEFNRLEAGRLKLQPEYANIAALAQLTVQRLHIQAEQAGIALINEVPASLPDVYMDSERINQVLTNLIENAIKATDSGGTIRVHARQYDDSIEVAVMDTGMGIPKSEQSKIFGRFYQLRSKNSPRGAHLGLGLTICQQIVEGHHGRIWVESEEGHGSSFIFTLPLNVRSVGTIQVGALQNHTEIPTESVSGR